MICLPLTFWVLHAVPPLPVVGFSMRVLGTSAVFSEPGGWPRPFCREARPNCIKQAVFLARLPLYPPGIIFQSPVLSLASAPVPHTLSFAIYMRCGPCQGFIQGASWESCATAGIVLRYHVSLILGTSPELMSSEGQSPGAHCTGVNKPYIQDS